MGQHTYTQIAQLAADEFLGVPISCITVGPTFPDTAPHASASAASATTDLHGAAAVNGARQIMAVLRVVAAGMLADGAIGLIPSPKSIVFEVTEMFGISAIEKILTLAQVWSRRLHGRRPAACSNGILSNSWSRI